jgi:SAM-dependent methyltransferase
MSLVKEIATAYDKRFQSESFRETDSFYRWIFQTLDPTPGARFLDMSCGEGHLLRLGEKSELDCYGFDISPAAIAKARKNAPLSYIVQADGDELPYASATFKYIANLGSLEHYRHPDKGVVEIARLLTADGRAVILLPNSYYLVDVLWQVRRTGFGPSHKQLLDRFATVGEWWNLLEEGGLVVQRVKKHNFRLPSSWADIQWYGQNPRKILNLLVSPLMPFNLSYAFLFLCTKS